jgi:hypothetical protein
LVFRKRENWAFIPIILILTILIFYSLFWFISASPGNPQLSAYSDDWDDISMFYDALNNKYNVSTIVSSPLILNKIDRPENKLYIVVGVEKGYSLDEGLALSDFLNNGGSVIIADDFGKGNTIADILNDNYEGSYFGEYGWSHGDLDIEFYNHRLYDPEYVKNTKFVKINVNSGLDRNYEVLLNEPTALKSGGQYHSVSKSSSESWLDKNDNGIRDVTEEKQAYDIIVIAKYGKGEVCFISDPGMFINDLWNMYDNAMCADALIQRLLSTKDGNEFEIILDESQHISQNTDESLRHSVYNFGLQFTSGIPGIIVIILLIVFLSLFGILKIKPLKKYKNRSSLNGRTYNFTKYPYLTPNDLFWLKKVFLEKVRNAYAYDEDEFFQLPPEMIYTLIHNDELYNFFIFYIHYPYRINPNYLYYLVELIDKWQPAEPGEYIEDRDEDSDKDHISKNKAVEFELLDSSGKNPTRGYEKDIHQPEQRYRGWNQNVD